MIIPSSLNLSIIFLEPNAVDSTNALKILGASEPNVKPVMAPFKYGLESGGLLPLSQSNESISVLPAGINAAALLSSRIRFDFRLEKIKSFSGISGKQFFMGHSKTSRNHA